MNTADSCSDTERQNCVLGENAVLLELCPLQMSNGLADYQTQATMMRCQQL